MFTYTEWSAWASRVIFKTLLNGARSLRKDIAVSTLLFTEPRAARGRRIYPPCVTHGHFILGRTTRVVTIEPWRIHTQPPIKILDGTVAFYLGSTRFKHCSLWSWGSVTGTAVHFGLKHNIVPSSEVLSLRAELLYVETEQVSAVVLPRISHDFSVSVLVMSDRPHFYRGQWHTGYVTNMRTRKGNKTLETGDSHLPAPVNSTKKLE